MSLADAGAAGSVESGRAGGVHTASTPSMFPTTKWRARWIVMPLPARQLRSSGARPAAGVGSGIRSTPTPIDALPSSFFVLSRTDPIADLVSLMAPDVVLITDGGGLKQAALRPIHGPDKIIRFVPRAWRGITVRPAACGVT